MTFTSNSVPAARLRTLLSGLVVLGWTGALRSQPLGSPLPEDLLPELRGYLQTAVAQSPTMIARNLDLAQAGGNRLTAASGLYPNLSASVQASVIDSRVTQASGVDSRSEGLFYTLGVSQPIFQWGVQKARADAGRIGVRIAEKNYAEAYRDLALTLRRQYLGLVAQKSALRFLQFNLRRIEDDFHRQEADCKAGRLSPRELAGSHMDEDEARLAFDRAAADYEQARRIFQRLAGLTELREETIPGELPKPAYAPESATQLLHNFLRDGPAGTCLGRAYADNVEQQALNYKIAKYQLYPKLSFFANIGPANQTTVNNNVVSQATVLTQTYGLAVHWTIFDGFSTRGAKLSALAGRRSSERILQNYLETVSDQAVSQERAVALSAQAMALAETRRDLAETKVKNVQDDAKLGTGSPVAVTAAQAELCQAESSAVAARADFLAGWSAFISTVSADPALRLLPSRYTE